MLRPPEASALSRVILSARSGEDLDPRTIADAALADLSLDAVAVAHVVDRASVPLLTRGPLAVDVERLHFELGEGPGLDAQETAAPVLADGLAEDDRWT